jgi:TrmH family RNA methyltransferase
VESFYFHLHSYTSCNFSIITPEEKPSTSKIMISKSRLAYLQRFQQKKIRDAENLFLIEGWRAIEAVVHAGVTIDTLMLHASSKLTEDESGKVSRAKKRSRQFFELSAKEMDKVCDTVTAQGIAALVMKFEQTAERIIADLHKKDRCLILACDRISEPGNLGTIIRTCDWFGVDAIFLSPGCVDLYNPKVVRSTVGSIFHLPIVESVNLDTILTPLHSKGFQSIGTDTGTATDIRDCNFPKKSILIIGNEAHGISADLLGRVDTVLAIPKFGEAESLNAAIAAGIIISRIQLQ